MGSVKYPLTININKRRLRYIWLRGGARNGGQAAFRFPAEALQYRLLVYYFRVEGRGAILSCETDDLPNRRRC